MALTDKLTAIADAIREKTGKTDGLTLDAIPGEIEAIQSGGGGGIPGITIIKGEYIPGKTIRISALKINHGLGEIKPFFFRMKTRNDHVEGGYATAILDLVVSVPYVDKREMTYGADATAVTITPSARVYGKMCNGSVVGSNTGGVTLLESETDSIVNYEVNIWPDGFNVGLYRNLVAGETYDYVLVYGDLLGGAV